MSDFELEKGRLQDNVVAASQAGLSPIDPGRALLQKLRHSSHIVEDDLIRPARSAGTIHDDLIRPARRA